MTLIKMIESKGPKSKVSQEVEKGEDKRAIKSIEGRKKAKENGHQVQTHRNLLTDIEEISIEENIQTLLLVQVIGIKAKKDIEGMSLHQKMKGQEEEKNNMIEDTEIDKNDIFLNANKSFNVF